MTLLLSYFFIYFLDGNQSGGLSIGAIIGIAVGVALLALAVIVVLSILIIRQNRIAKKIRGIVLDQEMVGSLRPLFSKHLPKI